MSAKPKNKRKQIKLENTVKTTNSANDKNEPKKQPIQNTKTHEIKPTEKQADEKSTAVTAQDSDVLVISENVNSKYSKRQIASNWTKYEVPIDTYEQYEDKNALGANFEDLLQMPVSSGHFQFKHEKLWVGKNKAKLTDDIFALDPKAVFDGVNCIPFYERNNIDLALFDKNHIERMNNLAESNRKRYIDNSGKCEERELAEKLLGLLSDEKPNPVGVIEEKKPLKEEVPKKNPPAPLPRGSAIEDIILNLDVDQWLDEHLDKAENDS